jgi:hypothetical protein
MFTIGRKLSVDACVVLVSYVSLRYKAKRRRCGSTVRVTMDDDDVVFPITINKGLIVAGLTHDVIDDMGDASATLFRSNVALINSEAAMASHVMGSNDHESLTKSGTSRRLRAPRGG